MHSRKRMMIVDGFNVLRSGSRYKDIKGPNPDYDSDWFNRAREMLVNDVAHYAGKDCQPTIVFDGGGNEFSDGSRQMVGGVSIIFSASGTSADHVIEKLAYEGRNNGYEVLVVTSDASIQDAVFGLGVDRMSAEGFSMEVDRYYYDTTLDDAPEVAPKRTVADRIDAETLAKLKALRDGD